MLKNSEKIRSSNRVRRPPAHLRDHDKSREPAQKVARREEVRASRSKMGEKDACRKFEENICVNSRTTGSKKLTDDNMIRPKRAGIVSDSIVEPMLDDEEEETIAFPGKQDMSKPTVDDNPEKLCETAVQQIPDNPFCSQGRENTITDGIIDGDRGQDTRKELENLRETLKETKQILNRSNKENSNLKAQIEDVRQLNKCLLKEVRDMENCKTKDPVMDELKGITCTTYEASNGVFYHKITPKRLRNLPKIIELFQEEGYTPDVSKVFAVMYTFCGRIADYICVEAYPDSKELPHEGIVGNGCTTKHFYCGQHAFNWTPSMTEGDFGDVEQHEVSSNESVEIIVSKNIGQDNKPKYYVGSCLVKRSMIDWVFSREYSSHAAIVAQQGYLYYQELLKNESRMSLENFKSLLQRSMVMKRRIKESCVFCLGNRRKKAKQYYLSRLGYDITDITVKEVNKNGTAGSNSRTTNVLTNISNGPDESEVIVPDTPDQEESNAFNGQQSSKETLNIVSSLFCSLM